MGGGYRDEGIVREEGEMVEIMLVLLLNLVFAPPLVVGEEQGTKMEEKKGVMNGGGGRGCVLEKDSISVVVIWLARVVSPPSSHLGSPATPAAPWGRALQTVCQEGLLETTTCGSYLWNLHP